MAIASNGLLRYAPRAGLLVFLGFGLVAACSDEAVRRDGSSADADLDAAGADGGSLCNTAFLGLPCSGEHECGSGTACLRDVGQDVGVCVCPCTPDDPDTLVFEDDCPQPGRFICGTVTAAGTAALVGYFCFERCSPQLGYNPCREPLACRPESTVVTGSRQAICAGVGCSDDWDCPVFTAQACDPVGTNGDSCPEGQRCHETTGSGATGFCSFPGRCDQTSGLCAPREDEQTFDAEARVGDPCADDTQCGPQMVCLRQIDGAETRFRNGYCTIRGCGFSQLESFNCPDGASCNHFYPPGLCQLDCDPTDASSCRGQVGDKRGDYECRAWNQVTVEGEPVAPRPVCDFGDGVPCDLFAAEGYTCAIFGVTANLTGMSCRDLSGEAKEDPSDATGFCLDETSSGGAR